MQFAFVVVVRQTVEETDEGLLHEIVAGIGILDAAMEEGAEPPFIAIDELPPRVGVALADRLDQEAVAFVGHAHSVRKNASVAESAT